MPGNDRRSTPPSPATYTRRRIVVGAATLALPTAVLWRAGQRGRPVLDVAMAPNVSGPPAAPHDEPPSTSPAIAPAADVAAPAIDTDVEPGMVGNDVRLIQQRLIDLRFDPGPVDGDFGPATTRSVWAAKRMLLGVPPGDTDGRVTPDAFVALQSAAPLVPRRTVGLTSRHVEVYLPEQVIAVFRDGVAVLVSHMSSGELDAAGEPAEWCEVVTIDTDERGVPLPEPVDKDVCGRSKTPGGLFEFTRRVDGYRHGALGSMWNPVYFNYGIAVHGSSNVPNRPASHGCVRIPMHIADYFPTLVELGDVVLVWNGTSEPEAVSEQDRLPVFDYPNPNTTTTSTTSTTTTSTTTTSTSTTNQSTVPIAGSEE